MDYNNLSYILKEQGLNPIYNPKSKIKSANDPIFFTSNDLKYTLKTFESSKKDKMLSIFEFQKNIHNKGFSCPEPISINNDLLFPIDDKYGAILKFKEGDINKEISPKTFYEMGKILGKYHQYSYGETLSDEKNKKLGSDFFYSILKKENISNELLPIFNKLEDELLSSNIREYDSRIGVAHGDIHRNNILFNKNIATSLIDFDNAYIGNISDDIGDLAFWLSLNSPSKFNTIVSSISKGYNEIGSDHDISNREIISRTLDKSISYSFWRLWQTHKENKNPKYLNNSLKMIEFIKHKSGNKK